MPESPPEFTNWQEAWEWEARQEAIDELEGLIAERLAGSADG